MNPYFSSSFYKEYTALLKPSECITDDKNVTDLLDSRDDTLFFFYTFTKDLVVLQRLDMLLKQLLVQYLKLFLRI